MPTIHALLIAINNYHPDSGVSSLAGCINDRNAVKKFIQRNFSDLQPKIHTLTDETATREGIIKTFRKEIQEKAKKKDTVLLYYAGHGSYTTSATAFKDFDGLGQDETFVCYDSRLSGNHDLTDKELAVLLSEINDGVHTVVIADSCHSASVTRMANFQRKPEEDPAASIQLAGRRFFQSRNVSRDLSSYLLADDNFYVNQGDSIEIPRSKHLLISACDRNEEAWETNKRRGLFTTILLAELSENLNISYRDLFAKVRTRVYNTAKNQRPSFYPFEGFNPRTLFLRSTEEPNTQRHQISESDSGEWRMELGAINGLPTKVEDLKKVVIGIYDGIGEDNEFLGTSGVSNMYITELGLSNRNQLLNGKTYWGEIHTLPSKLLINLSGRKANRTAFLDKYEKNPSPHVQLTYKLKEAKYTLHVTKNSLILTDAISNKVVKHIYKVNQKNIKTLKKYLNHVANWENIATLENKESKISDSIEVKFLEEKDRNDFIEHKGEDITIDYFREGEDTHPSGDKKARWYQIHAKNVSDKDLYVCLLHLNPDFGIKAYFPSEIIPANSGWKVLDDQHGLVVDDKKANQSTDVFKIITSTEDFEEYKFLLEDIRSISRGTVSRPRDVESEKEDWCTYTMRVNTIRPQGSISRGGVNLNGISFEPHPDFDADVSLLPIQANTRSIHPAQNLARAFHDNAVQVLDFSPKGTRSLGGQSIIELNNIQNPNALKEKPLVLNIDMNVEDGPIVPVTMKNGFIIPIGVSNTGENGKTQIQINELPSGIDAPPSTQKKRSLGRALWFSLLKITGFKEETFLLRKVVYKNTGLVDRVSLHKTTVQRAKKILLVIHGIIGDTKTMVPNLEFLQSEHNYDLIISFDYENLNTKIEDIAKKLNERLKKVGLTANDGKQLDILAHSMGGLVSRYLIEFIRKGDNLVDNLFMFGTPNGGSIFGEIPVYRDKLVQLLTVGLNFGKHWLGWVGTALDVANNILIGSKTVTVTLAQMSADSEFIDKLKDGQKGHAKYTIIAGDITDYQNIKEARFAKFVESVLLKIGNIANTNEPNDIAVLVDDIRAIPDRIEALKYDVCCHHLNYFESEEGLLALKDAVRNV